MPIHPGIETISQFYDYGTRTTFYGEPGEDAATAARHSRQVDSPLRVRAR